MRNGGVGLAPTGSLSHNQTMETPILSVQGLRKRYGDKWVVDELSFAIAPDAGSITAFGQQMPRDALAIKVQLGVVSQTPSR